MKIEIFTLRDCLACGIAKRVLETQNLEFTERIVHEDITIDEVKKRFPEVKTVPFIILDDGSVIGYPQLLDYFSEEIDE